MQGVRLLVVGQREDDVSRALRALRVLAIPGSVEAYASQEDVIQALRQVDAPLTHGQTVVFLDGRNEDVAKLTKDVRSRETARPARVFVLCASGVVLEVQTSGPPGSEPAAHLIEVYPLIDHLSKLHESSGGKEEPLTPEAEVQGAATARGMRIDLPQGGGSETEPDRDGPPLGDLIQRVRNVARRVCRSMPRAFQADAEGAAMVGLMEALQHVKEMDPTHFEGYLQVRVCGAIKDELRRFDPLSRRTRELVRQVECVAAEYRTSYGRDPEMDQLAAMLGVDEDTCWAVLELSEYHALPIDDETLASPPNTAEDRFIESYAATVLRWALGKLDERSRLVLRLWYKRGLPVGTIAKRLNVSGSRAQQIRVEAERKLAALFRASPPMSEIRGAQIPVDWEEYTYDTLKSGHAIATFSSRSDPIRHRGPPGSASRLRGNEFP